MNSDPWSSIAPPGSAHTVSAKRVDPSHPWNFFWALGAGGECLLVLRYGEDTASSEKVPVLRGIELDVVPAFNGESPKLVFRLRDATQREIFHRLCTDIIAVAATAATEPAAVAVTVQRTWRWHYLLRGGTDQKLSEVEQKGLIGELLVLDRILLPNVPANLAVSAWQGPLGAAKDFQLALTAIEVKARADGGRELVKITSEHQLDPTGLERLFLVVISLDRAASTMSGGFTLSGLAEGVRDRLSGTAPDTLVAFDAALTAVGFRWEDDYSENTWLVGEFRSYTVTDDFPKLAAGMLMSGIQDVNYDLKLSACESFRIPETTLTDAIKGD